MRNICPRLAMAMAMTMTMGMLATAARSPHSAAEKLTHAECANQTATKKQKKYVCPSIQPHKYSPGSC